MAHVTKIDFPEGRTLFKFDEVVALIGAAQSFRQSVLMLANQEPEVPFELVGKGRRYNKEGVYEIGRRLAKHREKYPNAGIPRGKRGRPRTNQVRVA